jgi:D-3-phosphoglycerate dehydrogenase
MIVFIADKLPDWCVDQVRRMGADAVVQTGLAGADLAEAVAKAGANVLIVRSTKVPADVIDAVPELSLIIRAGAGVDNIDTDHAAGRGIYVSNCPGTNSAAVAELAMGLILAVDRRIPDNTADLRAGVWDKKVYSKADGIKGKTLGVIGVGAIGRLLIARAKAFEMEVVAWSRSLTRETAAEMQVEFCESPLEVARRADVVSLHVARAPETEGMIDADFINAMKPGAILINTARGTVVDSKALVDALNAGNIRAGLDVYADEPGAADKSFDLPLREVPNWIGTHHIGASTQQAQDETAQLAMKILGDYISTGQAANCVNMAPPSEMEASCNLVVRHLDRVGVLAGMLDRLRDEGINVEQMENKIFRGARAAVCYVTLSRKPSNDTLAAFAEDPNIIHAAIVET